MRRILLPILMLLASTAFAEPDYECREGEWVLSVSAIQGRQYKAVEQIADASVDPVAVIESSHQALLVKQMDDSHGRRRGSEQDLCGDMRREERAKRLAKLKGTLRSTAVVRDAPSCFCNVEMSGTAYPNDPNASAQWAISQANNNDLDLPEAWDKTTGSSTVIAAVIDSGINYNHVDLNANMWRNPREIAGNNYDDDGNGYVDDIYGINAESGSGNPMDDNGHGTHVAGTIGARGNNGIGVTGVNWDVKVMGVKFLGSNGSGSLYAAMVGLDYVTAIKKRGENVVVTNNSWGCNCPFVQPLYDAIKRSRDAGIVFAVAAGNASSNNDSSDFYPSNYDLDNVISVGALNEQGYLASFSNYGVGKVHIAAPGNQISSTGYQGNYVYLSGTSMASPHVAGMVALAAAYNPSLTYQQLKQAVLNGSRHLNSLDGRIQAGRSANANMMLNYINSNWGGGGVPPQATPTPLPTQTPAPTWTPGPTPLPTAIPTATPTPTPTPIQYYNLSGQVHVRGTGLPRAKVELVMGGQTYTAFTTANGEYSFMHLPSPANYVLRAQLTGYLFPEISGRLTADATVLISGTERSYTVSGKVMMSDRSPIGGVRIDGGPLGTTTTDSSGRFAFSAGYGQDYTISASLNGYLFDRGVLGGTVYGDVERIIVATE